MPLRRAGSVILLMLTACGSSSAASDLSATGPATPHPAATCGPHSAKTLAASQLARVDSIGGQVYGCAVGATHRHRLGASIRTLREDRVGPVAIAGKVVAYGLSSFGVDTVSSLVIVRDLGNGQQLRAAAPTNRILPESFTSVDSIVVKADGATAWISQTSSVIRSGSPVTQVWRADAPGQSLLDSGGAIDARSLRRSGSTISWRDGSKVRSARLR